MKRDLVRAVMIINEIHVEIARSVAKTDTYNDLNDRLNEVKSILLDISFEQTTIQYTPENMSHTAVMQEIDWSDIKKFGEGC